MSRQSFIYLLYEKKDKLSEEQNKIRYNVFNILNPVSYVKSLRLQRKLNMLDYIINTAKQFNSSDWTESSVKDKLDKLLNM